MLTIHGFFPDAPFPVLPSVVVCHPYFLQSELIEGADKNPLIFPKEKTRGLNALNFVFDYLSQLCKDFGFALVYNALCHA